MLSGTGVTGRGPTPTLAKADDAGSSNPDPTMRKPAGGSPKGANVPPAGGESMAPADSKHPPGDTQNDIKKRDAADR